MKSENKETRKVLKEITSVKDFEEIINTVLMSEDEQKIFTMHYKEQKTITYIADTLGMSESSIKKKHSKLLKKIGKVIGSV